MKKKLSSETVDKVFKNILAVGTGLVMGSSYLNYSQGSIDKGIYCLLLSILMTFLCLYDKD